MKRKYYIAAIAAVLLGAAGMASCADLGFGVDVDSGGMSPYWYGNGWLGDTYWNTPVWNYGPIYNSTPPAPPLIGNGPGSVGMPSRPQPPRPQRPPQEPSRPQYPGNNRVPTHVGGIQRPGNGGMPNPSTIPRGQAIRE